MKLIPFCFVFLFLCTLTAAKPQQDVQILDEGNENDGAGNYNFRFSLSDGTKRDETGQLKDVQGEDGVAQVVVISGSYEFSDLEGKIHRVTFTADENGFNPVVES